MIILDATICFATALLSAFIVRQTLCAHSAWVWLFRLPLLCVAGTMLLKGLERLEGDPATIVDLVRDTAWMALLLAVISFHWKRFKRL